MAKKAAPGKKTKLIENITLSPIPEGYTTVSGPDNHKYLVPVHVVPELNRAFESYRQKQVLDIEHQSPSLSQVQNNQDQTFMHDGIVSHPPNPSLSDQERLGFHANILALQQLHGISYKDAAHRLYMIEIAKTQASSQSFNAFTGVADNLYMSLNTFDKQFGERSEIQDKRTGKQDGQGEGQAGEKDALGDDEKDSSD